MRKLINAWRLVASLAAFCTAYWRLTPIYREALKKQLNKQVGLVFLVERLFPWRSGEGKMVAFLHGEDDTLRTALRALANTVVAWHNLFGWPK